MLGGRPGDHARPVQVASHLPTCSDAIGGPTSAPLRAPAAGLHRELELGLRVAAIADDVDALVAQRLGGRVNASAPRLEAVARATASAAILTSVSGSCPSSGSVAWAAPKPSMPRPNPCTRRRVSTSTGAAAGDARRASGSDRQTRARSTPASGRDVGEPLDDLLAGEARPVAGRSRWRASWAERGGLRRTARPSGGQNPGEAP
jgi:hypothetical protein